MANDESEKEKKREDEKYDMKKSSWETPHTAQQVHDAPKKKLSNLTHVCIPCPRDGLRPYARPFRPVHNNKFGARISLAVEFHALLEAVGDGALASSLGLSEGSRAAKGTGSSTVGNADNADVLGTTCLAVAGHASGHLDLEGEVGVCFQGETADAEARNILGDFGVLEGTGIGTAG